MRFAFLLVTAATLAVLGGGCDTTSACCGSCPAPQPAIFNLTCGSEGLSHVQITGACAGLDAGVAQLPSYVGDKRVIVSPEGTGVCHVVLTFVTGFTYSKDVTFSLQPGGTCGGPQCKCGDYPAPMTEQIAVDNPPDTCVEAGLGAGNDAAADGVGVSGDP